MVWWGEWYVLKSLPQATERKLTNLMTQQKGLNEVISEVEDEPFGHLVLHYVLIIAECCLFWKENNVW